MPTMTSSEPSYTGTRECKCSRSAGRISAAGVSTSRQTMSGRGTMTDRTRVSSSSNTLWIISRSSRSTTPSLAPTSTSVLSSSSLSITCSTRSRPISPTVSAVSPARAARTGVRSTPSHATGRPAKARNRSGYLTASVMGRTSPKVVSTKISTIISTNTPQLGPKRLSAIVAAIAAAPMLITVMPISSVTSSSCGRSMSGFGAPSASSLSATCLRRARPREKYAASAPVRIAEQAMSTPSAKNRRPRCSGTGAPRHEVLEPGADGDRAPAGVQVADPVAGGRHLAHGAEPRARLGREPRSQPLEGPGRAGEQELVVLAAAGGPGERVPIERLRDRVHRGAHREPCELHARADGALFAQVSEVGGQAVGEIDHRRDPSGGREPLSLPGSWPGPQVRGGHVRPGRIGHVRGSGNGLQERKSGRRAAHRARDGDDVSHVRRGPHDRLSHRVAEQRDVDDPASRRCGGVPADHSHVVLPSEGLDARVEGLTLVDTDPLRTGKRDQRPSRPAAHRRDVRHVHSERLPADVLRRGPAPAEVHVLDEQVGRRQEHPAGVGLEDRAIVADAHPYSRRLPDRPPDDLDQAPLGRRRGAHPEPQRAHFKNASRVVPRCERRKTVTTREREGMPVPEVLMRSPPAGGARRARPAWLEASPEAPRRSPGRRPCPPSRAGSSESTGSRSVRQDRGSRPR